MTRCRTHDIAALVLGASNQQSSEADNLDVPTRPLPRVSPSITHTDYSSLPLPPHPSHPLLPHPPHHPIHHSLPHTRYAITGARIVSAMLLSDGEGSGSSRTDSFKISDGDDQADDLESVCEDFADGLRHVCED